MLRQSAVGHELVDEDLFLVLDGATKEADEVRVADGGEELDLVDDLLGALGVSVADALDGDPLVGIELARVDGAVGPVSEASFLGEEVGGFLHLFLGVDWDCYSGGLAEVAGSSAAASEFGSFSDEAED